MGFFGVCVLWRGEKALAGLAAVRALGDLDQEPDLRRALDA